MLLSPGQIIGRSLEIYKKHWQKILPYLGLFAIPSIITVILKMIYSSTTHTLTESLLFALGVVICGLLSLAGTMMLIRVSAALISESHPGSPKDEFHAGLKLVWPALFSSVLVALTVVGGIILLIVPGIIFAIWFCFVPYIVATEGKHGIEAMHLSHQLVRGRWWAVFARLVFPAFIFAFIVWAAQSILHIPFKILYEMAMPGAVQALVLFIATAINMLIAFAVVPLSTMAPTLLYIDLKAHPVTKT